MPQPVIIAGGSGTRLWPLSRKHYPKQFLPLINDKTLLQMTVERLSGLDCLPPIIVCHEEHRFIAEEQLRALDIDHGGIILEPWARNTAPAICLAALLANENNPQNQLFILPADHYMGAPEKFCKTVINAQAAAEAGAIVTFGLEPSEPATGYGYIKMTETENSPYPINQFIEKPCAQAAQDYISSGQYLWNSGIFLCSSGVYLSELEHFRPDIFSACVSAWDQRSTDGDFIRPDSAGFEACPEESIDYALMEHTDKAVVSPMDPQWTDLGSWRSLLEQRPKTASGNVETGDVLCQDSSNNYVYAQHKLVSLLGVDNLIVVDTQDALLVAHKDRVEDVKLIVQTLDRDQRSETLHHREVYRPWGKYNAMDTD